MQKIKCLIIDDEPIAQRILQHFVAEVEFLDLQGVCKDALEAMDLLKEKSVDLLFLDINMPQLSGLDFYKSLPNPPAVIFTTAYPNYAVEGFEVNAVDYLLKPIAFERFLTAVNKVAEQQSSTSTDRLLLKVDKTLHKLYFHQICYFEALGDYVKVHCEDGVLLTNDTLKHLSEQLPNATFMQIHKSFIVNLEKVTSVSGGQAFCNDAILPIGRKYKEAFFERWG